MKNPYFMIKNIWADFPLDGKDLGEMMNFLLLLIKNEDLLKVELGITLAAIMNHFKQ